jgi:hypothetical protein
MSFEDCKESRGTFFCRSKFQLIVLRIITENTQISFCAKEAILQIFLNQKNPQKIHDIFTNIKWKENSILINTLK